MMIMIMLIIHGCDSSHANKTHACARAGRWGQPKTARAGRWGQPKKREHTTQSHYIVDKT